MRAIKPERVAELVIGQVFFPLVASQRIVRRGVGMSGHTVTVPQGHINSNSHCAQIALISAVPVWHPTAMPKSKRKPNHFIKEWRKLHAKLSQEAAAERMGIDRSYISKVETGERRYDELFLEAAAKVYRCTPADLIGRHPQDKAA